MYIQIFGCNHEESYGLRKYSFRFKLKKNIFSNSNKLQPNISNHVLIKVNPVNFGAIFLVSAPITSPIVLVHT